MTCLIITELENETPGTRAGSILLYWVTIRHYSDNWFQQHVQLLQWKPQPQVLLHHQLSDMLQGAGYLLEPRLHIILRLLAVPLPGEVVKLSPGGAVELSYLLQVEASINIESLQMRIIRCDLSDSSPSPCTRQHPGWLYTTLSSGCRHH